MFFNTHELAKGEWFLTRGYARAYHELLQGDKDMQMSHSLTRSRRFRN